MAKPKTPQEREPGTGEAALAHTPAPVTTQERDDFVTHLIGRHGSPTAALTQIAGEQLKFKRRAQSAESNVADLQKRIPAADAVILTGEEAKAYSVLKGKGIALDKVSAQLDELGTLQKTMSAGVRDANLKDAAGKKYDVAVLTKLLGDTVVEFQNVNQMKEDKSGIETIKVPFVVTGTGDKATREALDTYVEREFAGFKEVLAAKEGEPETPGNKGTENSPRMPRQTPSGQAPKKDADVLKIVDKTTSTFMSPGMRRTAAAKP